MVAGTVTVQYGGTGRASLVGRGAGEVPVARLGSAPRRRRPWRSGGASLPRPVSPPPPGPGQGSEEWSGAARQFR